MFNDSEANKIKKNQKIDKNKIEKAIFEILEAIGEDVSREGLKETPKRVAKMCEEIFSGMNSNPEDCAKLFKEENCEEMIMIKDIPVYSICEHHLLPFFGTVNVVYTPSNNNVVGISKFARIVDALAKRPQLQERLTAQIADTIMKVAKPVGVAVTIKAEHLCMTMRGVKKPGTKTVTAALRGNFKSDEKARKEAMSLIQ